MNDILDIFYEYSINNKLFDDEAISKILDILLDGNNFSNYIFYEITEAKKFSLDNIWNNNVLAEFDMDSIIYIHYSEILKSIAKRKYLTKFDVNLNELEIMFKKNIMILETIFHEIEHVKQLALIKNIYNGSLEAELYRYEYDFIYNYYDISFADSIKRDVAYRRNYHLSFMERMANLNSFSLMAMVLYKLRDDFHKLYDNEIKIIDEYKTSGYKYDLRGPTTRFINNINRVTGIINNEFFDIAKNLCFDDRFRYGFEISEDEYKKKIKQ